MYKAIFLDIDGTLKNDKGEISERVINSIEKIKKLGIIVVLCSARNKEDTVEISKNCKASEYVIIFNGAEMYNYESHNIMFQSKLDNQVIERLSRIAEQHKVRLIISTDDEQIKYSDTIDINDLDILQARVKPNNFKEIKILRKLLNKINGVKIYELLRKGKKIETDMNEVDSIDYFFTNENTSKWLAIKYFCEKMNINVKDIISIGDGDNDVEMLENSGLGIAVANATDSAKQKADIIIPSNNEDGVAIFLEILEEKIQNKKISSEKGER